MKWWLPSRGVTKEIKETTLLDSGKPLNLVDDQAIVEHRGAAMLKKPLHTSVKPINEPADLLIGYRFVRVGRGIQNLKKTKQYPLRRLI